LTALVIAQGGLAWVDLPPIGWAFILFIVTNIFAAGVNYHRMRQFEDWLRREKEDREKLERRLDAHERDAVRHSIDSPGERATLIRHDRQLARLDRDGTARGSGGR
jgi:hypothetical protein